MRSRRFPSEPAPYLPIVKAMAPNAPSRRGLHDDADDGEHRMGEIVHETPDPLRALAQIEERKAEQDGEEQHLEDVADLEDPRRSCLAEACVGATDEGADDAVGNDVQDEVDRPNLPGRVRIALGLRGLLRCERDVGKLAPGASQTLPTVRPTAPAPSRNRPKSDERLQPNPADAAGFLDVGDARDDRAEDERRDRQS